MINKTLLTALAALALGVSAQATTITFQENGSGINLGPTSTFAGALTAYASPGENLYSKNDGPAEHGLGTASDPDHEINSQNFVQIKTINGFILDSLVFFGSIQPGESATIWYSLVQGVLGIPIGAVTGDPAAENSFNINPIYTSGYIGISASGIGGAGALPNVVLEAVSVHVPDGASTMLLLGSALTGLGLLKRKLMA
jgi:hypothetical protein